MRRPYLDDSPPFAPITTLAEPAVLDVRARRHELGVQETLDDPSQSKYVRALRWFEVSDCAPFVVRDGDAISDWRICLQRTW